MCPQCGGGKGGIVAYHSRINSKTADYIRSRWPDKLINVIPIGWVGGPRISAMSRRRTWSNMSKHIGGFYDQGWHGTYIAPEERSGFIKNLQCVYGTSGGRWMYPGHAGTENPSLCHTQNTREQP